MAKKLEEVCKLAPVRSIRPPVPMTPRCGCGKPADYEVYEHHEPHCRNCMLDAVDCSTFIVVRRIGGYGDAS